jgi:polynucleotide 5'-hydroxyl-kinase GRC3/NOL9
MTGSERTIVPDEWQDILASLSECGGCAYVIGATDLGKTTFCRYVVSSAPLGTRTAFIDCDTGQSSIGPPATLGLEICERPETEPRAIYLRFAGSTSPHRHIPAFLTGARRLLDRAQESRAGIILIDSPGFVHGSGAREFHVMMIDLLRPDHIVAFKKAHELEEVLANFEKDPEIRIHRFIPPPQAKRRSPALRRRYREQRFRDYFAGAVSCTLPLESLGISGDTPRTLYSRTWRDRLVALCDARHDVITLAVVRHADANANTLSVSTPPVDPAAVSCIQVGSCFIRL